MLQNILSRYSPVEFKGLRATDFNDNFLFVSTDDDEYPDHFIGLLKPVHEDLGMIDGNIYGDEEYPNIYIMIEKNGQREKIYIHRVAHQGSTDKSRTSETTYRDLFKIFRVSDIKDNNLMRLFKILPPNMPQLPRHLLNKINKYGGKNPKNTNKKKHKSKKHNSKKHKSKKHNSKKHKSKKHNKSHDYTK